MGDNVDGDKYDENTNNNNNNANHNNNNNNSNNCNRMNSINSTDNNSGTALRPARSPCASNLFFYQYIRAALRAGFL